MVEKLWTINKNSTQNFQQTGRNQHKTAESQIYDTEFVDSLSSRAILPQAKLVEI